MNAIPALSEHSTAMDETKHTLGGYRPSELKEVVEEHIASMWEDCRNEPDENLGTGVLRQKVCC